MNRPPLLVPAMVVFLSIVGPIGRSQLLADPTSTESVAPSPSSTPAAPFVQSMPASELPSDLLGLADMRGALSVDITTLEKRIEKIQNEDLPGAQDNEIRSKELQGRIDNLTKQQPRSEDFQFRLDEYRSEQSRLASQPTVAALQAEITSKTAELAAKRALAEKVQSKIASTATADQYFKQIMSEIFAALIGVVIIGFFVVSLRDEKIRQAIFSGEAGIQFLTLFSIVIAIILFGITGILEGKELAGLLGGLSGYILGRVTPKV